MVNDLGTLKQFNGEQTPGAKSRSFKHGICARRPPEWCMDRPATPGFVGRDAALEAMAQRLLGVTAHCQAPVLLHGPAGVGKTHLAREFARRHGDAFSGGIFWISGRHPGRLAEEVADCGGRLGMDLGEVVAGQPLPVRLQLVQEAWQERVPRLLIFDDCEDVELLSNWLPPAGGCRVLVTSRQADWSGLPDAFPLSISGLNRPHSVALLQALAPTLPDGEADELAAVLQDIPLALTLAGRFLGKWGHEWSVAAYLDQLPAVPPRESSLVAGPVALCLADLDGEEQVDQVARILLDRMAWLALGGPVPPWLLMWTVKQQVIQRPFLVRVWQRMGNLSNRQVVARREMLFDAGLARLEQLGLLEKDERGNWRIHRLVGLQVRQHQDEDTRRTAQAEVESALIMELGRVADVVDTLYLPLHLRVAAVRAMARDDDRAGSLCSQMGIYLQRLEAYQEAIPFSRRALEICEIVQGPASAHVASAASNLGQLLQQVGAYEQARPHLERALIVWEQRLGDTHPLTASCLYSMGELLDAMGDKDGAYPYFQRALNIWQGMPESNNGRRVLPEGMAGG